MKTCWYKGTDGNYTWSERNLVDNYPVGNCNCCITAVHAGKAILYPNSYLNRLKITPPGMAIRAMDSRIGTERNILSLIELGKQLGIEVKHENMLV